MLHETLSYLSDADIVEDMLVRLEKNCVARMGWQVLNNKDVERFREEAVGSTVRIHYKMWHEKNPHSVFIFGHADHPEERSFRIMAGVWLFVGVRWGRWAQ